ncbi:MAG TPA: hypothetical protein VNX26_17785 [Candidatus Acidoferrum sp.]|jgi:hypothetical protein|nr:hypothetical protein [Candidatus Acidoferrum sp.]
MAGSRKPGPINPPSAGSQIPPRTPGPLGVNDQADPNVTSLLGDTPGSLGIFDWADPTLPLYSSTVPYADLVCRSPDGFPLSVGMDQPASTSAGTTATVPTVALDNAQQMALAITTVFEGSQSMNYGALAGDELDGMGMSFGLIQWNFGQNTLGPILKMMLNKDAAAFAACFGTDANYDTLKKALIAGDQNAELKWARALQKSNRSAWSAAFAKVGSNATFNQIQLQQAVGQYHPLAVAVIKEIREIAATLFTNVEFRSYAAIFDLVVQQGGLYEKKTSKNYGVAMKSIKSRFATEKPSTQLDLMKIVVTERGLTASTASMSDCISRRMGILTGSPFKSVESGNTVMRKNPQLSLIGQFGTNYVLGL